MSNLINKDSDYVALVARLCREFKKSQIKASVKINVEVQRYYYYLGGEIVASKGEARWGSKFMRNLSLDLKHNMPGVTGLSETNLGYAKRFFELYSKSLEIHPPSWG